MQICNVIYFMLTQSASQKKLDEIKLLKERERELNEESRNKDQQYSQLVTEVQKLPKEVNRSAYTQRILEIINNIRKQRDEISKVLADTRENQKEINTLTGRLERSFTVVDELIFRDARTNEASRRAYKLLATLHSDCSELVGLVEETGATVREIRDLEEQVIIIKYCCKCDCTRRLIKYPFDHRLILRLPKMLEQTWNE